jgi:DNA-binding GntR family transcriptional regulator
MAERTQSGQAYQELTFRIRTGEIPAGERIVEELWADRVGVNRAAIREALTRLLGEGAVRQGARGGFFVAEMTDEEIRQLREVRDIIETSAFRLACQRATDAQFALLAEACDDLESFQKKGYPTAAHEADLRFHHLLVEAAGNVRLSQMYQRSHIPLFFRRVAAQKAHPEDFSRTATEHRAILESLRARNAEEGVARLRAHFNRGEREALA